MGRRVRGRSSTTVCRDVLAALDRIYLTEGPDEPDLGLNVAYVSGRLSLQRLASAEAWRVPSGTAAAIREALAEILVTTRPGELERQLLLAREVMEEAAIGDARGAADVGHRGSFHADREEAVQRRRKDAVAGRLRVGTHTIETVT